MLPDTASTALVAYYPFTNSFFDTSGNGNDGTPFGALKFTNGITVNPMIGIYFPGTGALDDEYVIVPRSIQDDMSVSFWIKTTNEGDDWPGAWHFGHGQGLICSEAGGQVINDWSISLTGPYVYFGVGSPTGDFIMVSKQPITDGEWHNVLVTRDVTTGEAKIWVDCVLITNHIASTVTLDAQPNLTIGRKALPGIEAWEFRGFLDEIRFYDEVLTPADITSLCNMPLLGDLEYFDITHDTNALVGNWKTITIAAMNANNQII